MQPQSRNIKRRPRSVDVGVPLLIDMSKWSCGMLPLLKGCFRCLPSRSAMPIQATLDSGNEGMFIRTMRRAGPQRGPRTPLAGHIRTRMGHGVLSYQVSSPIGFSAALMVVSPIAV